MASVFDVVQRERAALLEAIRGLHPVTFERPGVVGNWSVKDVLAHIAGWQDWMARAYPLRLEHGALPTDLEVSDANMDDWNRRFVEQRRGQTPDQVLEDLDDGMRRLLTWAANLGTTRLCGPNPWPGREESIADYFREFLANHDREHREQIERSLKVLGRR